MRRVAAISAGPRSAKPRGRRALSLFGLSSGTGGPGARPPFWQAADGSTRPASAERQGERLPEHRLLPEAAADSRHVARQTIGDYIRRKTLLGLAQRVFTPARLNVRQLGEILPRHIRLALLRGDERARQQSGRECLGRELPRVGCRRTPVIRQVGGQKEAEIMPRRTRGRGRAGTANVARALLPLAERNQPRSVARDDIRVVRVERDGLLAGLKRKGALAAQEQPLHQHLMGARTARAQLDGAPRGAKRAFERRRIARACGEAAAVFLQPGFGERRIARRKAWIG